MVLHGVNLPNAYKTSTTQEVDSLRHSVHDRDEEIKQLNSLLQAMQEMAKNI